MPLLVRCSVLLNDFLMERVKVNRFIAHGDWRYRYEFSRKDVIVCQSRSKSLSHLEATTVVCVDHMSKKNTECLWVRESCVATFLA